MRRQGRTLLNTRVVEAIPAWLVRARSNAHARLLARSDWLLRRKADGRFLAAVAGDAVHALDASMLRGGQGVREALDAIARGHGDAVSLDEHAGPLASLGIADDYGERIGLPRIDEPPELAFAGFDRYQRPLWLDAAAARAWPRLREAARADGIPLDAISGYRGHAYQLGIFERKKRRGLTVDQILAVNAAPGYSEHHSGRALDIGTPGEPPAEESFEATPAFAWLVAHARPFGFTMSYPRDNPHGIVYEPWHWCWHPAPPAA